MELDKTDGIDLAWPQTEEDKEAARFINAFLNFEKYAPELRCPESLHALALSAFRTGWLAAGKKLPKGDQEQWQLELGDVTIDEFDSAHWKPEV